MDIWTWCDVCQKVSRVADSGCTEAGHRTAAVQVEITETDPGEIHMTMQLPVLKLGGRFDLTHEYMEGLPPITAFHWPAEAND